MTCPVEVGRLCQIDYPFHDWTATVTYCGRICFKKRKVNLSQVFAGQAVGVKQVSDRVWLVSIMDYDLGYFDDETAASSRSRIRLDRKCYHSAGNKLTILRSEWTHKRWRPQQGMQR
jgi:putative transposase